MGKPLQLHPTCCRHQRLAAERNGQPVQELLATVEELAVALLFVLQQQQQPLKSVTCKA